MSIQRDNSFPHRFNTDHSCDSICPACRVTITSAMEESALAAHERDHVCDPIRLNQIRKGQMRSQSWAF
jgi:hypothetical protein